MMNEAKFYETIEKHDIDNNVNGIYDDYNGATTDARVIVVSGYGLDAKETAFFRWLDAICYENDKYEWAYEDQTYIDHEDGCAYSQDYGEQDVITTECEYIGRRQFENGDMTFADIAEEFINNSEKALPSWLEPTEGFEESSCDFEDGWYGRNDNPSEIMAKAQEEGFDVVFQIDYVNPFATGFCVWTKEVE